MTLRGNTVFFCNRVGPKVRSKFTSTGSKLTTMVLTDDQGANRAVVRGEPDGLSVMSTC
jgi:hypothetical protein